MCVICWERKVAEKVDKGSNRKATNLEKEGVWGG